MGSRKVVVACALSCAIALISGCSPYGGGSFACSMDTQCGAGGVCSDGFCSFPDPSCDSGLRWGELSGPFSNQCVGDQLPIDARPLDTNTPSEAGGDSCFGTGLLKPCFTTMPVGDRTISGIINTDTSGMCDTTAGNAAWCVIAGDSLTVSTTFVVGSKPLVIVATSSINVSGTLDVASHRVAGTTGAAGNAAGCNAGTAPTGTAGGAGGSFGGSGGAGAAIGTAGMPGGTLTVTALHGGCPGQSGAGTGPGAGGRGGGAVYLIASTTITVGGSINASGSGGINADAMSSSGGGGGGSGGMIGLDAPSVMVSGSVFANGGGGAEASGSQTTGQPGADPANATTAAPGGAGNSLFGTDGGPGSIGGQLAGSPGVATCGGCGTPQSGGGGGGGAGVIKLYGASAISGGGPVSPPAT